MFPRLTVSACLVVASACSLAAIAAPGSAPDELFPPIEVTELDRTNHARMLERIEAIRLESQIDHPYVGRQRFERLERVVENGDRAKHPRGAVHTLYQLGNAAMQLGENERAVEALEEALALALTLPAKVRVALEIDVRYTLGTAYMRLGEVQNCVARHTAESCLLPILEGGVHVDQHGSRKAIENFERVCELVPEGDARRLACRWVINVLYMTVGGYPDDVPDALLIPTEIFTSAVEFPRFRDVAPALGLNTTNLAGGVVTEDFDRDGDLDILTSSWDPSGQLRYFRNESNGSFVERTEEAGLTGILGGLNMAQADYNNDGHVDVLLLRGAWLGKRGQFINSLLRNNGDGTFVDATLTAGVTAAYPTSTAAWCDYDQDGDVDVFVGAESMSEFRIPCQLYRNEGDGTFVDVALAAGVDNLRFAKGASWGDYDGDGDPDLFVSNFGDPNRLYRNKGDGTFEDVAVSAGVDVPLLSFATWFWDYDNDGALDLYVGTYQRVPSYNIVSRVAGSYLQIPDDSVVHHIFHGDGKGGFVEVGRELGMGIVSLPMGANFGDLDNDGFLDMHLGTGSPAFEDLEPNKVYRNRRGTFFDDVTFAGGFGHLQKGHGVAFCDLDNDGDQDLFAQMGGAFAGDAFGNALFENPGFGNGWVRLELIGTESNRAGIGVHIRVRITEGEQQRWIYRDVNSGGSFGASSLTQHIGVGQAEHIDELEITWPASGRVQRFEDVAVRRHFRVFEDADELVVVAESAFTLSD